jgi:hypothetical protein
VDNVWLVTGKIAPYFMQPDFGGNSLRIVQDWDLNQEEAYITMVTTVLRTRKPMHFGDNPIMPLFNAIDSYNFHIMQYMRLYLQWKKYLYPKDKLDVPMQPHISEILECFNTVMRISQRPVAPTSTPRNTQYSIKHTLWKDVPVSELRRAPFHTSNEHH